MIIVVYVIFWIMAFVTGKIMRSNNESKQPILIGAVLLYAAIQYGIWDLERGENLYDITGMPRSTLSSETKPFFRKVSKQYHPDHNPSPDATDEFARVKESFDILGDKQRRFIYETTGQTDVISKEDLILKSNPFFVTWLIFGLSATSMRTTSGSRKWMLALLFLVGIIEGSLSRDPGDSMLYNDWPYTLKETVNLAKALYPVLLVMVLLYFESVNLSKTQQADERKMEILESQSGLLRKLNVIQEKVPDVGTEDINEVITTNQEIGKSIISYLNPPANERSFLHSIVRNVAILFIIQFCFNYVNVTIRPSSATPPGAN